MKKLLFAAMLGMSYFTSHAQWAPNVVTTDTDIYRPGNVTIGSNTPSSEAKLNIVATGDGANILKLSSERPWVFLQQGSGSSAQLALRDLNGGKYFKIQGLTGADAFNIFSTTGDTYIKGKLALGAAAAGAFQLYANGSVRMGFKATVGHSGTHYDEYGYNIGFTNTNNQYTYLTTDPASSIRMGYGGAIEFRTAPSGNEGSPLVLTNRMYIAVNGNVGIGTTTPDYKLTVDGGVKCEEISVEIVEGTGPDYVFEKDYNLLPLSEIEAYINEHKHLPEVPSAKEMEANGLNLKEMNLLLLKKVEELTLHLIEMNNQNRILIEKVESMEKILK